MNSSFQTLRDMYTQKTIDSFATSAAQTGAFDDFAGMPTASWDFYYEAEQEDVPTYRVEIAKSNRSACAAKGKAKKCCTLDEPSPKERNEQKCLIPKGSLRVGHMDKEHGSYGRWKHLNCWRVPSKVRLKFKKLRFSKLCTMVILDCNYRKNYFYKCISLLMSSL